MRPEVRPTALDFIEARGAPECANPPVGYESLPALLRGLLGASEQRWHGSVIVRNLHGESQGVLRCHAGQVTSGLVARAPDLLEAVVELCSSPEVREVSFVPDADLVGAGPEAMSARLDILQLTAAVLRTWDGGDCVASAVEFIGERALIKSSKISVERYAFTVSERCVIESLRGSRKTLSEIHHEAALPGDAVDRIVCTLWITRAITLVPAWLRAISSGMDPATMSLVPPRSDADDPTLVVTPVAKPSGRYSERPPPAHAVSEGPSPSRCPPPTAASPQALADAHFEVAQVLLARGYPREAVLEAQKGMRLCRPRSDQEALYAWALYQRGGAGQNVHPHVWEHLENALRTDPSCEIARRYWALLTRDEAPC